MSNDTSSSQPIAVPDSSDQKGHAAGTIDDALIFLRKHGNEQSSQAQDTTHTRSLRRKIDLHVISFLTICYMLNFLDKVLLNYSQVMGLSLDLNLTGNNFSNAASAFFIADLVAVLPNIYLLQRLPTAHYLGFSLIAWGICTACHASLQNYGGLLTVRILSGAFESAVPPALILLSSQYYTRSEQAARFAYWYSGMGLGQILGGLISFAFQHVGSHAALAGWRIMFLVLGIVTIGVGGAVCWFVPNTPMRAWFLD
ncbi:Thiamine pathway transporter THI73, partial [Fulvia fulva]